MFSLSIQQINSRFDPCLDATCIKLQSQFCTQNPMSRGLPKFASSIAGIRAAAPALACRYDRSGGNAELRSRGHRTNVPPLVRLQATVVAT